MDVVAGFKKSILVLSALALGAFVFLLHSESHKQPEQADAQVTAAAFGWEEFVVSSSGVYAIRESSHMQIDADTAYVAFRDQNGEDLRFAKTTDGGDNWTDVLVEDGSNELGTGNSIYATDANTVFISYGGTNGTDLRFAYSTDAGDTWTTVAALAGANPGATDVYAPTSSNPMILFHSNGVGALRFIESNDGGATWGTPVTIDNGAYGGITIEATDSSNIFVSGYDGAPADYIFSKSTDGGSTFDVPTLVYSTDADQSSYASMDVVDANNIFFAIAETDNDNLVLAESTNGGSSWSTSDVTDIGSGEPKFISMAALDTNTIIISYVVGQQLYVADTTDGGSSWDNIAVNGMNGVDDSVSLRALSGSAPTIVASNYNDQELFYLQGTTAPDCYIGSNGIEYCVVTSTNPIFDTGNEVCATFGKTCLGYTLFDESVCVQANPTASVDDTSVDGSRAGYYCDGAPQTGPACEFETNVCKVCPTCTVGVSCSEPVGALYREMYVECANFSGSGVGYDSGGLVPDGFPASNFTARNPQDEFGTRSLVLRDESLQSNVVIPMEQFNLMEPSIDNFVSDGTNYFAFYTVGSDPTPTTSYNRYVGKFDVEGDRLWEALIDVSGGYHSINAPLDLVADGAGGAYAIRLEGDDLGGGTYPTVTHINSVGTPDEFITYPTNSFFGVAAFAPRGSGQALLLLVEEDDNSDLNLHAFTGAGVDPSFGIAGTSAVSSNTTSFKSNIEIISDGSDGAYVLWQDAQTGEAGVYVQHITSDGSIEAGWDPRGELVAPALGPIQADLVGTNLYISYIHPLTNDIQVVNFDVSSRANAWQCAQDLTYRNAFDVVGASDGVFVLFDSDAGGLTALSAQHFNAVSGDSTWQNGGELIDEDFVAGGGEFLLSFNSLQSVRGMSRNESDGFKVSYAYDSGNGYVPKFEEVDSSSFAAGPGSDCLPTPPSAPTSLNAIPGNEQVTLTWNPAISDSAPIDDYIVEYGESSGWPGNAQEFDDGIDSATGAVVTGLTNEIEYSFRVYAENAFGVGPASSTATATPTLFWELDTTNPMSPSGAYNMGSAVEVNGLMYLFGGMDSNGDNLDLVRYYDPGEPDGSRWFEDTTDPMPAARAQGCVVTDGSLIYYLMGYEQGLGATPEVFIYDPSESDGNRWTTGTPAGVERYRTACAYDSISGNIYLIGGFDESYDLTDTVLSYDTVNDTWVTVGYAPKPTYIDYSDAVTAQNPVAADQIVYVAMGFDEFEGYDIVNDTWLTLASLPTTPYYPCSMSYEDKMYVSGIGADNQEVWEYDPSLDTWTMIPKFNRLRFGCSGAADSTSGILYAFGGGGFDDFETFNLNAGFSDILVNTTTANGQASSSVAIDEDGNFVVVWESAGALDGDGQGVFAQRFDNIGDPVGSEFQVNTSFANDQGEPDVAMNKSTGDFIVVWTDGNGLDGGGPVSNGIFGQRFDSSGTPVGSEFQINTQANGAQDIPSVAMSATGSFVVVWRDDNGTDGDASGVFGQLFDENGDPVGSEFQVNTQSNNHQTVPSVAMSDTGAFIVAWMDQDGTDGSGDGIFAQLYDEDGDPVGTEFQVNTTFNQNQREPDVAMDADGDFVIAFNESEVWSHPTFQRYNAAGVPQGVETRVDVNFNDLSDQENAAVSMTPDGAFIVTWRDRDDTDGDGDGIFMRSYAADGTPDDVEQPVNQDTAGDQTSPAIAAYANGWAISWTDEAGLDGDGEGVFARLFTLVTPNAPTLIFPEDGVTRASTVVLSALYDDASSTGTTEYRISDSSLVDCVAGTNIVATQSSATTATESEATKVQISGGMSSGNTYYWCARNTSGSLSSAWTQMASFEYDAAAPDVTYVSYLGGSGGDRIIDIAVDSGVAYLTGLTTSSDFPTTLGAYDTSYSATDIFVSAIDPSLNGAAELIFSTFVGGLNTDAPTAMDIDSSYIYVVGYTGGSGFPTTGGAFDTVYGGGTFDGVAFRLDIDGSALDYSTFIGGSGVTIDSVNDVQVVSGDFYMTGQTASSDFPTTPSGYDTSFNGIGDVFFSHLSPDGADGADMVYSTFIGGARADVGYGIAVNGTDVYLVGKAEILVVDPGFPSTPGAYDDDINGGDDMFVIQLDTTTSGLGGLVYASFIGTGANERAHHVVYDAGLLHIQGVATTSGFPTTPGAYSSTYVGPNHDVVYMTFEPLGGGDDDLVYSTYVGPSGFLNQTGGTDHGSLAVVDGDAFITGIAGGSFPVSSNAFGVSGDGFLARLNPGGANGADLVYAMRINDTGIGGLDAIAFDGDLAYVGGSLTDLAVLPGFEFGATAYDESRNGGSDAIVMVIDFAAPSNSAPTAPTNLFSNNSNAQAGQTNPTGITSSTPVFSAICNDLDSGDILDMYRIQVDNNNDFSSTIWDSGALGTAMANCVAGARSANITFGGAPLAQDGTTYYWRIKFWDDEPSEGAFSQTISTNTFTMATSGGGGGGGNNQAQQQQATTLGIPAIGPLTVLGTDSVRFDFTYSGSNQTGFRLLNEQNQAVVQVANSAATSLTQTGLPHNTLVTGRKVVAYNNSTQGLASATYPDTYTHIVSVTPSLVSRVDDRIRVRINEALNNLIVGQSGVQFELLLESDLSAAAVEQSPWTQTNDYVFEGTVPGQTYYVRSRSRNANGSETAWSSTLLVEGEELIEDVELLVGLAVMTANGTQVDPDLPLNPNELLYGEITLVNNGSTMADNVFLALPLPQYLTYLPGSLSVDGIRQTDAADLDAGQAGNDIVAAIWPTLDFAFGHTVRFALAFDTPRLIEDFIKPVETDLESIRQELGNELDVITTPKEVKTEVDVNQIPKEPLTAPEVDRGDFIDPNLDRPSFNQSTESLRDVLAQAIAATGPQLTMQASASHAGDPQPSYSNPVTAQPDLVVLADISAPAPAPEPTPEPAPVPLPTPEDNQTIEQVLQEEFGTPQPGAPILETGETSSSFDGESFGLSTDNGLAITGTASTVEDQIQFTGTTSQPFTVVTLILNDSVTLIVVSDANGEWRTFVDAETLGIQPGQQADVHIEAIAAKGDIRSERVTVGDVTLVRGRDGEVVAEFDTIVSENSFITAVNEISRQTIEVIQEQEPAIQTTLTAAAPVIVVSSVPLWGYLPYIPTLIYHFIAWLLGLFGRKKKEEDQSTFGVVYDAITKLPLPLAIVRIYNSADNKLAGTIVTDKQGRYDMLLTPGQYRFEVAKPQYQFPSAIVTTSMDGMFNRVYQANQGTTVAPGSNTLPHIPVDPINVKRQWELSFGVRKAWLAFQRLGNHLATPIMLVGFITALGLVYANPSRTANWVMAGVYAITLVSQIKLKPKLLKAWGVVYDMASDAILPLVTIQLIEPATSKVVTSRLSDYEGRFTFLPEPGNYVVKASKPGFTQVTEVVQGYKDRQPLPQTIDIKKPNQRISGDVAMKQQL